MYRLVLKSTLLTIHPALASPNNISANINASASPISIRFECVALLLAFAMSTSGPENRSLSAPNPNTKFQPPETVCKSIYQMATSPGGHYFLSQVVEDIAGKHVDRHQ